MSVIKYSTEELRAQMANTKFRNGIWYRKNEKGKWKIWPVLPLDGKTKAQFSVESNF